MNPHDATEQAYRNGYAAGHRAAKRMQHWQDWTTEKFVYSKKADEYVWKQYRYFTCSGCGYRTVIKSKYCPDCGAEMK